MPGPSKPGLLSRGHTIRMHPAASSRSPVASAELRGPRAGSMSVAPSVGPPDRPRRTVLSRGFVDEETTGAGEFHCRDFTIADIEEAALERLAEQAEERRQHTERTQLEPHASTSACETSTGEPWEGFYRQHSQGRFFKARRYLTLEFPVLGEILAWGGTVAEVGCGNGSTLLPLLAPFGRESGTEAQPRGIALDISPTAVRLTTDAALRQSVPPDAVVGVVCDASARGSAGTQELLDRHGGTCDAVLLIFVASALATDAARMDLFRTARDLLRPGGVVLFRDYGLYDMSMLRFPGAQMLGERLYRRGDGTLAYFYTIEEARLDMQRSGLTVEECEYHCVLSRNRKKGTTLHRVFVHAVARRPDG